MNIHYVHRNKHVFFCGQFVKCVNFKTLFAWYVFKEMLFWFASCELCWKVKHDERALLDAWVTLDTLSCV